MEIHQLRYFCAVVRNGSFTRAAQAERISQPSLSQQILKLENELGAKLFDRLPRSVKLTSFGTTFLPKAERILRDLSEAKAEILEMTGTEKGGLSIGAIPTLAPYLLPRVLTKFSRQHPSIAVKVVEDTTLVLLDLLRGGRIDIVVAALPVPGSEFTSFDLFSESFFIVVPEYHPLSNRKSLKLQELRDEPFLLLKEGHCFRESTIALCRAAKILPNVVFESGQFATILGMVSAGMGISAVPQMAVQPVPGCRFIPLADENAFRRIGAVVLVRHFQTRAEKIFLQHLLHASAGFHKPRASAARV